MRKTSQDGGDSQSITSIFENDIKKAGAGIIKAAKRNSIKRKVQNFSIESDDAVVEPLLQKDKTDGNQSAKYSLSKTKTDSISGKGNDTEKLLGDSKVNKLSITNVPSVASSSLKDNTTIKSNENPTLVHNHMNTNVFHQNGTKISVPKSQILVEIETSKFSGYSPSPLIFTTAKIHIDGKTKQMEPVQVTPVPILSTIEGNAVKTGPVTQSSKLDNNSSSIYAKSIPLQNNEVLATPKSSTSNMTNSLIEKGVASNILPPHNNQSIHTTQIKTPVIPCSTISKIIRNETPTTTAIPHSSEILSNEIKKSIDNNSPSTTAKNNLKADYTDAKCKSSGTNSVDINKNINVIGETQTIGSSKEKASSLNKTSGIDYKASVSPNKPNGKSLRRQNASPDPPAVQSTVSTESNETLNTLCDKLLHKNTSSTKVKDPIVTEQTKKEGTSQKSDASHFTNKTTTSNSIDKSTASASLLKESLESKASPAPAMLSITTTIKTTSPNPSIAKDSEVTSSSTKVIVGASKLVNSTKSMSSAVSTSINVVNSSNSPTTTSTKAISNTVPKSVSQVSTKSVSSTLKQSAAVTTVESVASTTKTQTNNEKLNLVPTTSVEKSSTVTIKQPNATVAKSATSDSTSSAKPLGTSAMEKPNSDNASNIAKPLKVMSVAKSTSNSSVNNTKASTVTHAAGKSTTSTLGTSAKSTASSAASSRQNQPSISASITKQSFSKPEQIISKTTSSANTTSGKTSTVTTMKPATNKAVSSSKMSSSSTTSTASAPSKSTAISKSSETKTSEIKDGKRNMKT